MRLHVQCASYLAGRYRTIRHPYDTLRRRQNATTQPTYSNSQSPQRNAVTARGRNYYYYHYYYYYYDYDYYYYYCYYYYYYYYYDYDYYYYYQGRRMSRAKRPVSRRTPWSSRLDQRVRTAIFHTKNCQTKNL